MLLHPLVARLSCGGFVVHHSLLANIGRKRKITPKMQFAMWFAGLRGAIAFALAMNMPNVTNAKGEQWDNDVIVTTTLISAWRVPLPPSLSLPLTRACSPPCSRHLHDLCLRRADRYSPPVPSFVVVCE